MAVEIFKLDSVTWKGTWITQFYFRIIIFMKKCSSFGGDHWLMLCLPAISQSLVKSFNLSTVHGMEMRHPVVIQLIFHHNSYTDCNSLVKGTYPLYFLRMFIFKKIYGYRKYQNRVFMSLLVCLLWLASLFSFNHKINNYCV